MKALAFQHGNDTCLSFWALAWEKGWTPFPPNATVLEIGCAEADWQTPMLALRPDLKITGIDWRPCVRPGETICGDVLRHDFPENSFDAIVSISAIEHVGLSAYDGDPFDRYGDTHTMQRAYSWLKPGGWMYLDVPYRPDGMVITSNYRGYDDAELAGRIVGPFTVLHSAKCDVDHPDSPYMALLLGKS